MLLREGVDFVRLCIAYLGCVFRSNNCQRQLGWIGQRTDCCFTIVALASPKYGIRLGVDWQHIGLTTLRTPLSVENGGLRGLTACAICPVIVEVELYLGGSQSKFAV